MASMKLRIMREEEAFLIYHTQDQHKALYLLAKFQNLPWSSDGGDLSLRLRAFLAFIMDLFDYLIAHQCIYCDVCALMGPAARILRRLALQKTSAGFLRQLVHLESSRYEFGPRQVSYYARSIFCRYFEENHHESHKNLNLYVKTTQRDISFLPDQAILSSPISPARAANPIDGLQMKLRKLEKAKEELAEKRKQDYLDAMMQLRCQWENLQENAVASTCNFGNIKLDVSSASIMERALYGMSLEESILRLAVENNYKIAMSELKAQFFTLKPTAFTLPIPEIQLVDLIPPPNPVLQYQTLVPRHWHPVGKNNVVFPIQVNG